jgi:4-amino-4-deoxy-L-arabinose transferase-like glycosyltransferase
MKKKHYFLFLLCAAVMILFFNNIMPVTDNVESNYALTAKEMVLSGDWISPQIYGTYWYDKPVFFYWLTAIAFKIFGFTDFAARFFPSVFGIVSLGFIGWCGRKLFSEKAGFLAMLILSSFLMFFAISKLIITDAVLFLFFNATLMFFYLGYQGPSKNYYYLMYICAGLATLTKGPIGFLLPGLIIVLFLLATRNFKEILHAHLASGCCLFLTGHRTLVLCHVYPARESILRCFPRCP